jgi:hypothetical protein
MALQIGFFMAPEDERELFRRLERMQVELWPEYSEPSYSAPIVTEALAAGLDQPAYYFAAGDVEGYPIKRGKDRGRWKIDEIASPVVYFFRSQLDEDGQLRSGYFWAESESAGDNSRMGNKPAKFHACVRDLQEFVKARFRKSSPVKGSNYYVGQAAARLSQQGTLLREEGRKGELVVPYR